MRAAHLAIVAALIAAPAYAQNTGAGGAGKASFQNLRSYTVRNDSKQVVTSVRLISTNGGRTLFNSAHAIQPDESSEAQVGRNDCLAAVIVRFKDGRQLRADNLDDCKRTRISIGNKNVKLESAAVH